MIRGYYKLLQLTLLQIATRGYLQIATGTLFKIATNCITNCDRYYKLQRPLLQFATSITNCDDHYYNLRQVLYYKLKRPLILLQLATGITICSSHSEIFLPFCWDNSLWNKIVHHALVRSDRIQNLLALATRVLEPNRQYELGPRKSYIPHKNRSPSMGDQ